MKKLINYLKTLWSWVADSQSTDVSLDCRRSDLRRSPSGFNSKLMLKLVSVLVLILTIGSGNAWGTEEVYKETIFNSTNNSGGYNQYSDAWSNTTDGFQVDIENASNNNNGWNYIKIGNKNNAYTGKITTHSAIDDKITKVSINIGSIQSTCVTSITLYTSPNNSTWTSRGTFTMSTGWQNVTISAGNQAANLYYKIEVVTTSSGSGSNGRLQINGIKYYHDVVACDKKVTITKGTPETGGSFSLDKTGEQNCCNDLVVTVSNIVVPSGKIFSAITQSGIASGVTIDQNAKTVTYAANSTGASTINVTFADKGCTDKGASSITGGASTDDDYGPICAYNTYSTRQILYTKSDLDLAVGKKGTIKSIYFEYAGGAAMAARTIKIYMANTALTELTTSSFVPYASFTEVYDGSFSCSSTGWYEITLDTPFDYNGIGNLVVLIDDNTNSWESSKTFKYHTESSNTKVQLYYNNDGSNEDPATTNWSNYSATDRRPNTKFCIEVKDMVPSTVTLMDNSATLIEVSAGAGVTLPSRAGCSGYTFAGWTKSWVAAQSSWTTTAPIIIPAGSYTPAGDENLYPVYTKTEGGGTAYTKVTSVTTGTYVLVSEKTTSTYRYMPNTTSSGSNPSLGSGITMSTTAGVTTLTNSVTDAMLWDFVTGETSGYFYVRPHGSSTIGLGTTNTTGTNIRISSTYVNTEWRFATSASYGWEIYNGSMYLAVYADDAWRNYSNNSTNQNGKFYLFKQTSASVTSYISVPNCCTDPELAYGTGSVTKTYGASAFTNTLTNSHSVAVTYGSSDTDVATVAADGTVTIKQAGSTTITASSVAQTVAAVSYCADEASYTLTVNKANISPTLTYSPNSVAVGENSATPTVGGNTGSGTVTYAITSASPAGCATINTNTGVVTGVAVGSVTVTATVAATDNYNGNTATATVTITAASNFPNNKTIFIQAHSTSAWTGGGCVMAWFHSYGGSETAQPTYWLFDAGSPDEGKKLFAAIVPSSGNLPYLDIQRFAANCNDWWNKNGGCSYADANGSNAIRSTGKHDDGSDGDYIRWNNDAVTLGLRGDPDWNNDLATFADQGNGVWTATYNNYAPANAAGESQEFKICTNYNGWIGNSGSNNNVTVDGMHVGSTYNIGATLDIKDHSLTLTKTFVKGTVHFNMQSHGSAISDLTNVAAGSKISAPSPAPTAAGYTFGGWFKEPECTNEWNFASDEVNETMTLYAKWTYIPTITFSAPSGATAPSSQLANVTLPSPTGFPSAVDDDCWAFAGWTESSSYDGTGKPATFYPAGTTYNGSQASNFTLYAVYSRNKYLVVYNNDMLTAGTDYIIATWNGDDYAITGAADGNNAAVLDMETYFHDKVLRGLHYYTLDNPSEAAVWSLTGSTDSWVLQNKATGKYLDLSSTSSPMISNSSATLSITEGTGEDSQTYKLTKSSNHLVISSSGASVATGDATYYFLYKLLSSKYTTSPVEPTFRVTYKVSGQSDVVKNVNACTGITALDIPSAPDDDAIGDCADKFMGWSATNVGSSAGNPAPADLFTTAANAPYLTGDKTLYAVFAEAVSSGDDYYEKVTSTGDITDGRYLIVYETGAVAFNGGLTTLDATENTIAVTIVDSKITPADAAARTAHAAAEFTIDVTNLYVKSASDKYIDRSAYSNGLDESTSATAVHSLSILSGNFICEGTGTDNTNYVFLKYNATTNQQRFRFYKTGQEDIQLYKFHAGTTYGNYRTSCNENEKTVTYNAGEGGSTTCTNATVTKGSNHTVCSTTPTRSHYTFQGWTADVDVTINSATVTAGTIISGGSVIQNIQTNIALTASWTPTAYTITYNNLNGATNTENPATYTYVSPTITLQNPGARAGYIFKGWFDDAIYTNQVTQIANGSSGDIAVYAKWAEGYTITWNNAIGSNPASTLVESGNAIGTLPIPTGSCTVDGTTYSNFVGWYTGTISGVGTAASDAGTEITSADVPTANATYHAVYTNMPDYSGTNTSNVTLPASPSSPVSTAKIKVSSDDDAPEYDGIKIGTSSSKTGSFTFTVPSGTTKITVHAVGWTGKSPSITLATSVGTISPNTAQAVAGNTGATGNSPFTITSGVTTLNFTLSGVNSTATITLSNSSERVVVWGINASSASGSSVGYITQCCDNVMAAPTMNAPTVRTSTAITLSWNTVTNATGYKVSWNGGDWEDVATATTYEKTSLEPGTDYSYKVIAKYTSPYCGASAYEGVVSTKPVFTVTYQGGSGTGTCNPDHVPTDANTYEEGAAVTLPPTSGDGNIHLTGNSFAAWSSEQVALTAESTTFTMPAENVTVTATWTANQDKYYDNMHNLTATDPATGDPGTADGAHYYIVREGCNYTVPSLTNSTTGDTDCHTTHYVLMGWAAASHIQQTGENAGQLKPGDEHRNAVFTGGGTKSATGATYYAIWAIVTE